MTSFFNQEIEFNILPWLENNDFEVMEVYASPMASIEEESDDENEDEESGSDDGNDHHVGGEDVIVGEEVAEIQSHVEGEIIHVKTFTPPVSPPQIQTHEPYIPSSPNSPLQTQTHEPYIPSPPHSPSQTQTL